MSPYYILPTPASQVVALKREIMHLLSTKILKTAKNNNFSIFYIFTPSCYCRAVLLSLLTNMAHILEALLVIYLACE